MAKKTKSKMAKAKAKMKTTRRREDETPTAPEFPKTLVKVTRAPGGGYSVEEAIVADADGEASALENGFQPLPEAASPPIVEYPGWRYHKKQGARLVQSEAEADQLGEGWQDTPIVEDEDDDNESAKEA